MPAQAQSPVDSVVDENAVSNVTITDTGVKFNVSVPWQELGLEVVTENGKQYTRVSLEGWTETGQAGAPLLPMLVQQAAVPVGAEVELWVVSGEAHRIPLSAAVLPVETMRVGIIQRGEALPQLEYVIEEDAAIYGGGEYPGALAMVMNDGMLRQQRVIGLSIYPVQYDAAANELIVYESLEVELKYSGGMLSGAAEADSEVYEEVFAGELLNYESSQEMREAQGGMMMRSFSMFGAGASLPWAPPSPAWRVKVREDGLYKLTHYELVTADAGFGTPDSSMLQLFNLGTETAIQVLDVNGDGLFNSTSAEESDAILFYGQKIDSKYTYDNVYWLTYGAASGLRMSSRSAAPGGGGQPAYFWANRHYEEKLEYWPILQEDAELDRYYWHRIENPDPLYPLSPYDSWEFKFNTPTRYVGEAAELRLNLLGAFELAWMDPEHHALITLNGTQIGDVSWDGMVYHEVVLDNVQLLAGENTLVVTLPGDNAIGLDRVYVEWAEVKFPANFIAEGDVLEFSTQASSEFQYTLSGFTTPDLALFDVTDPWNVQEIVDTAISPDAPHELTFTDTVGGSPEYLAQSRALYKTVRGIVVDNPSNLQSGSNEADYILITPSEFWAAAGTLTDYRAGQGLRAVRVDVQDIYDEFNYGIVSANAIHDFLKYTYENWDGVAPSYVVLLGDGNYDPKNYEDSSKTSYIPPYLASVDPWMGETAGDNRYVTVSGADTMPDMMLGRLAVNSADEAEDIVDKIIAYEANPSEPWQNQVLAVADNADTGGNFPQLSDNLLAASLAAPFTAERVYLSVPPNVSPSNARTAIQNHINSGKLIVNFIGHGAYNQWAGEGLLTSSDISSLANGNKLPIMLAMACNDGYYIYPQNYPKADAMAEALTRAQGKGAIASWSATALGLSSGHSPLNQGFMETLLIDENVRLGQATQAGKLRLWSTNSNLDLLDTFLLFGDPALVVKRPPALKIEGTITINSVPLAGVTVTSSNGKQTLTDSNGHFVFKGLPAGTYTFTPSKTGYDFDPQASSARSLSTSNISDVNFSASLAPIYTISGTVTNHLGNPLQGATVSDDKGHTTTTGTLGEYALSGLTLGIYQVGAVKDDYIFRVPSYTVEITGASRNGINFTGLPLLSISGAITKGSQPVEGVELNVVSYEGNWTGSTNSAGEYLIDNITPEEYEITPHLAGYDFTPATQTVALNLEDINAINFQAEYRIKGSDIPDQFILLDGAFADIPLDDFVADPDHSDDQITWTFSGNTNLDVTISDRVAHIEVLDDSWTGSETITFRATNQLGLSVEDTATFTVFDLSPSPNADQKLAAKRVTFQWAALPGANLYTLQVSLSPAFTSTVVNITTNQPTYAYTKDLTDRQTYYWRVRARYGSSWGDWMPNQQLKFYSMNPPLAPVLTAPAAGNFFNLGTLDFSWDAVANDDHYELEINKSSAFKADANRVVYETNLDRVSRTYTATGLANGVYYWRVRAVDEVGVAGAWSAVRSFTYTSPTAKSPLAYASISTKTPVFTINPVAGAKWYRFRVVEGADCEVGIITASSDISTTSWAIPAANPLPFGDNYSWCAKAINAAGSESDWMRAPFTITIQNQPAANQATQATTPTFTWYKVNGATGYELVVEPVAETGNTAT